MPSTPPLLPVTPVTPATRTVTTDQVDRAVQQLRERAGRPPAELMQAVLRALDLTVDDPVIPVQRG